MRRNAHILLGISLCGQALVITGFALYDLRASLIVLGLLITIWATFLIDIDRRNR